MQYGNLECEKKKVHEEKKFKSYYVVWKRFCGAKFNEMVYFRRNSIRCPGCGIRMHGLVTAKRVNDYSVAITNIEKVEAIPKVTTSVVKVPIEHVITDVPGNIKITDIVLAPTATERTIQIANQEVIPFRIGKADKLNALSTLFPYYIVRFKLFFRRQL